MNGHFGPLTHNRTAAGAGRNFIKENYAPWSTRIYLDLINEDAYSSFTLAFGLINEFHFWLKCLFLHAGFLWNFFKLLINYMKVVFLQNKIVN